MTQNRKRFPFWLTCLLIVIGAACVGGWSASVAARLVKGGRTWKEMAVPHGEQVDSILGAKITVLKEQRLCVRTKSGNVFLWRAYHPPFEKLNRIGTQPTKTWRMLKPLPDGQKIEQLIISQFDADEYKPVLIVKSDKADTYAWMGDEWLPFYGIRVVGVEWPEDWSTDSGYKRAQGFRSWFVVPAPRGKVVDEKRISFEGALSWWVTCYALLDDGRLMVLAAETDVGDVMCALIGFVVGLLAGIVVVVILGIRRKRARAKAVSVTSS